jgi:hypothetical protein
MPSRIRNLALVLMLVASAAWSASARAYVECADGTPCPEPAGRPAVHACCAHPSCDEQSAPPPAPCVLRVTAAPESVAPPAPVDVTHRPLAAFVSPPIVVERRPAPAGAAEPIDLHPPASLSAERGLGPRAPPPRHA